MSDPMTDEELMQDYDPVMDRVSIEATQLRIDLATAQAELRRLRAVLDAATAAAAAGNWTACRDALTGEDK